MQTADVGGASVLTVPEMPILRIFSLHESLKLSVRHTLTLLLQTFGYG